MIERFGTNDWNDPQCWDVKMKDEVLNTQVPAAPSIVSRLAFFSSPEETVAGNSNS